MVYDTVRRVTVLFGGSNGGEETWEWPRCKCLGEMSGDSLLDGEDVQVFLDCLLSSVYGQPPGAGCECMDVDDNGLVEENDITAFVDLMLSVTACPD